MSCQPLCSVTIMKLLILFFLYFSLAAVKAQPPVIHTASLFASVTATNDHNKVFIGNIVAHTNCTRDCSVQSSPLICYFHWTLELYHTMGASCGKCSSGVLSDCSNPQCVTADGVERGIMTINRMLPGPAIQVCQHDRVVIDVHNQAGGTGSTIHWHGIKQINTPWMDGVPMITQCPIHSGNTFRYDFLVPDAGTHLYHSHSGLHKMNGHYGALIVRKSRNKNNNVNSHYDYDYPEHVMVLSDWMHEPSEHAFPGLRSSAGGILPVNALINGKGKHFDIINGTRSKTPYEKFYVKANGRHLFRVINACSLICPLQIQIEKHPMTLVALDGHNITPEVINTLVTTSGERFDVVINCVQKPGVYWVRIKAIGTCTLFKKIQQFALLVYDEQIANDVEPTILEPKFEEDYPQGVQVNHPKAQCGQNPKDKCVTDLKSIDNNSQLLNEVPYSKIYLDIGYQNQNLSTFFLEKKFHHFMENRNDAIRIGYFNGITFEEPPSPLLTQYNDAVSRGNLCASKGTQPAVCKTGELCHCTNIVKIPLGKTVELIITDKSEDIHELSHPVHIHGHVFHITGMGIFPNGAANAERTKSEDSASPFKRLSSHAPVRDTVLVPSRGYVITKFVADNPGFWFFHCHFDWHMVIGMAFVIQVGETNQMKTPLIRLPTCGDYMPPLSNDNTWSRFKLDLIN